MPRFDWRDRADSSDSVDFRGRTGGGPSLRLRHRRARGLQQLYSSSVARLTVNMTSGHAVKGNKRDCRKKKKTRQRNGIFPELGRRVMLDEGGSRQKHRGDPEKKGHMPGRIFEQPFLRCLIGVLYIACHGLFRLPMPSGCYVFRTFLLTGGFWLTLANWRMSLPGSIATQTPAASAGQA